MTAPDHTPYLLATGLRTAWDVARWQREHFNVDGLRLSAVFAKDVIDATDERLDRERRQACRRGALEAWVNAIDAREGERVWKRNAKLVGCTYSPKECLRFAAEYRSERPGHLQLALAFRAAARAK